MSLSSSSSSSSSMTSTTSIGALKNDDGDHQQQQIPRWLLEFHHDIHSLQNKIKSRRPSTDQLNNRPKWFEELSQKRRMSDILDLKFTSDNHNDQIDSGKTFIKSDNDAVNDDEDSLMTVKIFDNGHNNSKIKVFHQRLNDMDEDDILNAFNHRQYQNKETINVDKHVEKSKDFNFKNFDDDYSLLSSSTFKSIENLRLDEFKANNIEDPILNDDINDCIIPEMPTGMELCLYLLDNWGDQNFIGLNGIEILDRFGNRPLIENVFIDNENNDDLYKLIDNVYRTHDDAHIWQCNFDQNQKIPIKITFKFKKPIQIALIRIWNYNKSRIHSYRGVRYAKFSLDEQTIFCGEIARACGNLNGSLETFGDTILFTTNDEILEQISHSDLSFQELLMEKI